MSIEQNYGTYFQPYDENEDTDEEDYLSEEEYYDNLIKTKLYEEEHEMEEIKEADKKRVD